MGKKEKESESHESPPTAFLLAQVGGQAAIRFAERVAVHKVSPPQVGLLFSLASHDGASQGFLAKRLGVVAARIVVLIDELEELGLVERRSVDRRTYAIHLTEHGREVLKGIGATSREHNAKFLGVLDADEKAALRSILEKIVKAEGLTPGVHPGYKLLGR